MPVPPNVRVCTHIKVSGVRCGSPALRGEQFCYFHQRAVRGVRTPPQSRLHPIALIEDEQSIQYALMEVINALMRNTIDLKRATLILRALHIAVKNARYARFDIHAASMVKEVPDYPSSSESQVGAADANAGTDAACPEPSRRVRPSAPEPGRCVSAPAQPPDPQLGLPAIAATPQREPTFEELWAAGKEELDRLAAETRAANIPAPQPADLKSASATYQELLRQTPDTPSSAAKAAAAASLSRPAQKEPVPNLTNALAGERPAQRRAAPQASRKPPARAVVQSRQRPSRSMSNSV